MTMKLGVIAPLIVSAALSAAAAATTTACESQGGGEDLSSDQPLDTPWEADATVDQVLDEAVDPSSDPSSPDTAADPAADASPDTGPDGVVVGGPSLIYSGPRDAGAVVPGWDPDNPRPLIVFSRYSAEPVWHVSMAEVSEAGVVGGMVTDELRFWGW
jgi:hypothetical protein